MVNLAHFDISTDPRMNVVCRFNNNEANTRYNKSMYKNNNIEPIRNAVLLLLQNTAETHENAITNIDRPQQP